jgi:hypothetical protein
MVSHAGLEQLIFLGTISTLTKPKRSPELKFPLEYSLSSKSTSILAQKKFCSWEWVLLHFSLSRYKMNRLKLLQTSS